MRPNCMPRHRICGGATAAGVISALATLLLAVACGRRPSDTVSIDRQNVAFDSLFVRAQDVVLEESTRDPIVDVRSLAVAPDGRIAIPDTRASRVRVFESTGKLVANIGRRGDGPGEFRVPIRVAFDAQGRLYVADGVDLSRFDRTLAFDTVQRFDVLLISDVEPAGGNGMLLNLRRELGKQFAVVDESGRIRFEFFRDTLVRAVPYWGSIYIDHAAVTPQGFIAATSLLYPVRVYDRAGKLVSTFGEPPGSWQPARRPRLGEFAIGTAGVRRLDDFLRSFTQIDGLALLRDSLWVIVHGRFDPGVDGRFNVKDYALDIYRRDGVKLYSDVPVPGNFLGSRDLLYFLVSEPPDGWRIQGYDLREVRQRVASEGN